MLDRWTRRLAGGRVLLGGEPVRLLSLSERGAAALGEVLILGRAGDPTLTARLVDGGLAHPVPARRAARPGEVSVVVPVLDDSDGLRRLLPALDDEAVIVVDDGSRPIPASAIVYLTTHAGARLVRHAGPNGPAAARNAARATVAAGTSELVAFLDADALPEPGWLGPLLGHFDDPQVAAVAPRVRPGQGGAPRWLFGYERANSPLDLGAAPGRVGAHRRLPYVPTAALVCRRSSLEAVGWFDGTLRVGEDVDLVRRLERNGWVVRYEPASGVEHDCRPTIRAFVAQRFAYGRSAALLDRLHPGTVAPFETGRWTGGQLLVGVGALVCFRARRSALAGGASGLLTVLLAVLVGVPTRTLRARLRSAGVPARESGRVAVSLVLDGLARSSLGALSTLRRVWWPPVCLAAAAHRRWRRPCLIALAAAECLTRLARRDGRRAPLLLECSVGPLDDVAYGAGVWAGCWRARSLGALVPRLQVPARVLAPACLKGRPEEGRKGRPGPGLTAPADAASQPG